jgi:hypothetical protein
MPCAAPCNRLPCDKRCRNILSCGHQCPSLCGEHCPQGYCQDCGDREDDRVDLLEFRPYKYIELDESPIVVLGCGHFFTAESLDGLTRLGELYTADSDGQYTGLAEPEVIVPVPKCPDCKRPIRQFATQRYNRVVNTGVMDETSKKLLVKGQREIQNLDECIHDAKRTLGATLDRERRYPIPRLPTPLAEAETSQRTRLMHRYEALEKLEIRAIKLRRSMDVEQQPCKKLFDAILEAKTRECPSPYTSDTTIHTLPKAAPERRLIFAASLAELRVRSIKMQDQILMHAKASVGVIKGSQLLKTAQSLLRECELLFDETSEHKLPKYTVISALIHAAISSTLQRDKLLQSERERSCIETSKALLERSKPLCEAQFEGAALLAVKVDVALRRLGSERYEEVTKDEMKSIKLAMISGPGGISTHSGHWYKCQNGHAVSKSTIKTEVVSNRFCGARLTFDLPVCHRRVWDAHGRGALSRMWI